MNIQTFIRRDVTLHNRDLPPSSLAVFRDVPCLYEGSAAREERSLADASSGSLFVLARQRETVIGTSAGKPIAKKTEKPLSFWLEDIAP